MTEQKVYANLTVSKPVYDQFRAICDYRGWKYNKQVEKLMKEFNERHGGQTTDARRTR